REAVLPHHDLLGVSAPLGCDGEVGDRGQADATGGGRAVVGDQLVGDQPVRRTSLEGRGLDGPVAQPDRPQDGGSEDIRGGRRGHAGTLATFAPYMERVLHCGFPADHRPPIVIPWPSHCGAIATRRSIPRPTTSRSTRTSRSTSSPGTSP